MSQKPYKNFTPEELQAVVEECRQDPKVQVMATHLFNEMGRAKLTNGQALTVSIMVLETCQKVFNDQFKKGRKK